MDDYEHYTDVDASADALFDYLADIDNLPDYFQGMVSAEPAQGEAVDVVAMVGGERKEGEAWLHRDREAKHMSWGAEGPNDYHGELDVEPNDGNRSRVTVSLHTTRGEEDRIRNGLENTLANIKRLVEQRAVSR